MAEKYRSLTLVAMLGAALPLAGCPSPWTAPAPGSSPPSVPAPTAPSATPAPAPPAPPAPRQQAPPRENHLSPATRSLVTQAHTLLAHGDIDGASSTLDRALRIEPSNPLLWIELGKVRLVGGK